MVLGTALAFGLLAAAVASMKDFVGGNTALEFSYKSVVAFVVGFAVGIVFWRIVGKLKAKAEK